MKTLVNRRKVEKGRIFNAYFDANLYEIEVTRSRPFGAGTYQENVKVFDFNGKTYAILGYDHFNGHFSGYKDPAAVFGLRIAEVKN